MILICSSSLSLDIHLGITLDGTVFLEDILGGLAQARSTISAFVALSPSLQNMRRAFPATHSVPLLYWLTRFDRRRLRGLSYFHTNVILRIRGEARMMGGSAASAGGAEKYHILQSHPRILLQTHRILQQSHRIQSLVAAGQIMHLLTGASSAKPISAGASSAEPICLGRRYLVHIISYYKGIYTTSAGGACPRA
jgi:hypothetical protein